MRKKISLILTLVFLLLAMTFAITGTAITGFVVAEPAKTVLANQVFAAIFLFLGLATFVLGILHE